MRQNGVRSNVRFPYASATEKKRVVKEITSRGKAKKGYGCEVA